MPELPDVEVFRRYVQSTALHEEIEEVDLRAERLVEGTSAERLEEELKGRSLEKTRRHGKYLFVELDDGRWLVLHFGMTGELTYFKELEDDPEYDRVLFTFANGYHLAYESRRKLGEVEVVEDADDFIAEKGLGPDVLSEDFGLEGFREALEGRRGMIKSALMDQSLMAGIGNVYSDEILFQVGLHPRAPVKELGEGEREELYRTVTEVLETAIDRQAKPEEFPAGYLTPHRHDGGKCPQCGGEVQRVKVAGRGAYYCPCRQGKGT